MGTSRVLTPFDIWTYLHAPKDTEMSQKKFISFNETIAERNCINSHLSCFALSVKEFQKIDKAAMFLNSRDIAESENNIKPRCGWFSFNYFRDICEIPPQMPHDMLAARLERAP